MLDANSKKVARFHRKGLAVTTNGIELNLLKAINWFIKAWNGKTTLGGLNDALGISDLGVNEDQGLILTFGNVDDDEPFVDVHLAGGQADTGAAYMVSSI